jgi:hypothetical protein
VPIALQQLPHPKSRRGKAETSRWSKQRGRSIPPSLSHMFSLSVLPSRYIKIITAEAMRGGGGGCAKLAPTKPRGRNK